MELVQDLTNQLEAGLAVHLRREGLVVVELVGVLDGLVVALLQYVLEVRAGHPGEVAPAGIGIGSGGGAPAVVRRGGGGGGGGAQVVAAGVGALASLEKIDTKMRVSNIL